MNLKSDLTPTQNLVYIRTRFRMDLDRLYPPEERIEGLLALVRSFSKVRQYKTVLFLSLLGLMAATYQSMEYTHLHMHPMQWFLKRCWNHVTHRLRYMILVNKDFNQVFQWWSVREWLFHYPIPPSLLLWM